MEELKVSSDVASQEFDAWCVENEFDFSSVTSDQQKIIESAKSNFIKAMTEGYLSRSEDVVSYTLHSKFSGDFKGKTFEIKNPGAKLHLATDNIKEEQSGQKMAAIVSCLTGQEIGIFKYKIGNADYKVLESLALLFLIS